MVERQCHQKQNFQSLLSRNDFYGDRTFYHITAELLSECLLEGGGAKKRNRPNKKYY